MLPATLFAYQKDLGYMRSTLCESHTMKSAMESGQEDCSDRFCVVYTGTVSIKSITASYGGRLSEQTGMRSAIAVQRCAMAAGQCFGPVIVPCVEL